MYCIECGRFERKFFCGEQIVSKIDLKYRGGFSFLTQSWDGFHHRNFFPLSPEHARRYVDATDEDELPLQWLVDHLEHLPNRVEQRCTREGRERTRT